MDVKVGFPEKNADFLAQYKSSTRTPKSDLTEVLADALDVSAMALNAPLLWGMYNVSGQILLC